MKTLHLVAAAAAVASPPALPPPARARREAVVCSCSPTEYEFRLDFDGKCDEESSSDSTDAVPGGDPVCFFVPGGALFPGAATAGPGRRLESSEIVGGDQIDVSSHRVVQERTKESASNGVDLSSHISHAQEFAERRRQRRKTQGFDTTPTVVTSVSFLEFDHNVKAVINQDSTYSNASLNDGDVVTFTSISSSLDAATPLADQIRSVPGGVMLVLFGVNAEDQIVQNTVAWSFENESCEAFDPTGNGWAAVSNFTAPRAEYCPETVEDVSVVDEVSDLTTLDPGLVEDEEFNATNAEVGAPSDGMKLKSGKSDKAGKSSTKSVKAAKALSSNDAKAKKEGKSVKMTDPKEPAMKSSEAEIGEAGGTSPASAAKSSKIMGKAKASKTSTKAEKSSGEAVNDEGNYGASSKAEKGKAEKSNAEKGEAEEVGEDVKGEGNDVASGKAEKSNAEKGEAADVAMDPKAEKESTKASKATSSKSGKASKSGKGSKSGKASKNGKASHEGGATSSTNSEELFSVKSLTRPVVPERRPLPWLADGMERGNSGLVLGQASAATKTAVINNNVRGMALVAMVLFGGLYWSL